MIATPAPHDALPATSGTAGGLLAHNAPVALWPLALVALGWPRLPAARRVGDVLVAGQLVAHGVLVGNALGQHPACGATCRTCRSNGSRSPLPAGAWLTARTQRTLRRGTWLVQLAVAAVGVLALAAIVETYLVPLP